MQNYNERGPKKRKKEGKKSAMFLDTGKKQWESLCTEIQEQTMSMLSSQVLLDEEEGFVFDVNFLNGRPDPRVIGRFN